MKKWFFRILTGASLTASAFIFQACYGVPTKDYDEQLGEKEETVINGILEIDEEPAYEAPDSLKTI